MRSLRTAMKSSPRSPQLEKARAQQRRPNAEKKKKQKTLQTSLPFPALFYPTALISVLLLFISNILCVNEHSLETCIIQY